MALSTVSGTRKHFHILEHLGVLVFHCVENLSIKFNFKEVLKMLYILSVKVKVYDIICTYGRNDIIKVVLPYHEVYTETVPNCTIYFFGL